jgi:hypothetical protein
MAQPPDRPIMSRLLVRATPFVTPRTFQGALGIGATVSAQFDTLEGFADPNFFNNVGAWPGAASVDPGEVTKAVGPWLDAAVYSTQACALRVEYAVDRGCAYHQMIPDIHIPLLTFQNISGLRITGRFIQVLLVMGAVAGVVEFGVYVRSA